MWQMANDLDEAKDSDIVRIDDCVATGFAHATAPHAEKLGARFAMPQRFDQFGAVILP